MYTVEKLYEDLDKAFPNRVPHLAMTDREIWMAVGVRKIIDLIAHKITLSQESVPEVLS